VDGYAKREAEIAKLRGMLWLSGTREDVEERVKLETSRLIELDNEIKSAIAATMRTDPGNVLALVTAIRDQTFSSEAAKARWGSLKTRWGLQDLVKLDATLSEPREFERVKKEKIAAEKNLELMEKALARRLDLSGAVRNSDWNRALADAFRRLDEELQPQRLSAAVNLLDVDRIVMPSQTLPLELEKLRVNYDEWKEKARQFVINANLLEDHFDAGFGLLEAKPAVATVYDKLVESGFWDNQGIKLAMVPLVKRYEALESLKRENQPARLLEKIRTNDPALVLDAWKRLASADVNWPASSEDLERERQLRKTLAAVIESRTKSEQAAALARQRAEMLVSELQQQGPVAWRRFMVARRSAAEVEAALKKGLDSQLMKDFGVPPDPVKMQPPLPVAVQHNILVYLKTLEVLALKDKLDNKSAQVQVRLLLDSLPAGDGADAVFGKLRAGLMELTKDAGSGAASVVDAGPMSQGAQNIIRWERRGTPERPAFSWNGHVISFVRLEGAVDGNGKKLPPYYLCTTEMTVGLFRDLMDTMKLRATDLNLGKGNLNMPGPQLWDRTGADSLKVRTNWLKIHTQIFDDFPSALLRERDTGKDYRDKFLQADANPTETMPMQNVSPEAALLMAELLGCRLPTSFEWQFALGRQPIGPQALPNLRDASWDAQLKHVNAMRADGNITAQFPDVAMFPYEGNYGKGKDATAWNAQWQQQFNLNVPVGFNDGYIYLRPVGDGTAFSDLIGNVSEMVFDVPAKLAKVEPTVTKLRERLEASQDQLFVVGGSCMSPPEVGFAKQPCGMHGGYADTGFRVAFEAANRLIVDRLKDLMSEQQYVAVTGSTGAPAN
jgi:formylglycine-generating enzyme required for sulfatase activity